MVSIYLNLSALASSTLVGSSTVEEFLASQLKRLARQTTNRTLKGFSVNADIELVSKSDDFPNGIRRPRLFTVEFPVGKRVEATLTLADDEATPPTMRSVFSLQLLNVRYSVSNSAYFVEVNELLFDANLGGKSSREALLAYVAEGFAEGLAEYINGATGSDFNLTDIGVELVEADGPRTGGQVALTLRRSDLELDESFLPVWKTV